MGVAKAPYAAGNSPSIREPPLAVKSAVGAQPVNQFDLDVEHCEFVRERSGESFDGLLLAVYAAARGIGASVTLDDALTTTPDRRARNCAQHRLRHRHYAKGVCLKDFTDRCHRRNLEDADNADPRVVNEHVNGTSGFDCSSDALGLRHADGDGAPTDCPPILFQ